MHLFLEHVRFVGNLTRRSLITKEHGHFHLSVRFLASRSMKNKVSFPNKILQEATKGAEYLSYSKQAPRYSYFLLFSIILMIGDSFWAR